MPIDVEVNKGDKLVCRTVTGMSSIDEMIASIQATLQHPDYRPGMRDLTDLREHVHKATRQDIERLAQWIIGHAEEVPSTKAAVVVSNMVSYGMTRMLQMHLDELPSEIAVFYDIDEAKRWLGCDCTE